MKKSKILLCNRLVGFEVVTVADYYGGTDEKEEAGGNKYFCAEGDEIGGGGKLSIQ
jgi:hypothetical protein